MSEHLYTKEQMSTMVGLVIDALQKKGIVVDTFEGDELTDVFQEIYTKYQDPNTLQEIWDTNGNGL